MKRLTTIAVSIIGVLAMGAVTATGASAEAPEYGRCVKGVAHEGGFAGPTCIATDPMDNDGVYEWLPGPGPKPGFRASFSAKSFTEDAVLETVKGAKLECRFGSNTGEFVGTKELRIPSIKFGGCQTPAGPCSTKGAAAEEIVTPELSGHLRFRVGGKAKKQVVLELVPTSGSLFLECSVGGFLHEVRAEASGGILNYVVADKMLATALNKYQATKGEQKPSEYEDPEGSVVPAGLEESFAGGPFEEAGLTLTSQQTNEEPIEANAVV
jgi:hypothetical protein